MGGRPLHLPIPYAARVSWLDRVGVGEWYGSILLEVWEFMDSLYLEHHRPDSDSGSDSDST